MPKNVKSKTMFSCVLYPLIAIVILLFAAVYAIIFFSGIFSSAEKNSVFVLSKSCENRYITLENNMVGKWSDIGRFADAISDKSNQICISQKINPSQICNSKETRTIIEEQSADILIDIIRQCGVNGAFFIISDGCENDAESSSELKMDGTYIRNVNPVSVSVDNSDLIMERGNADIAKKLNIPLDSFWTSEFSYSPDSDEINFWKSYFEPFFSPREKFLRDQGYWNPNARLANGEINDSFIVYSVPVYIDDVCIGVIGTEIQYDYIDDFFPAGDTGDATNSGYMLIYSDENGNSSMICATGSIFKRLFRDSRNVSFDKTNIYGLYKVVHRDNSVECLAAVNQIKLYNSNTHFSRQKWSLAAVATENSVFGKINSVKKTLMWSSLISLLIIAGHVWAVAGRIAKPIANIVGKLEKVDDGRVFTLPYCGIKEIDELSSTINSLSSRQANVENELREERQRYLLALESSIDIIIEYFPIKDVLRVYHVSDVGSDQAEMFFDSYDNFRKNVECGKFCHPDDKSKVFNLINGKITSQTVIRIYNSSNTDYLWLSCRVKPVFDDDGILLKIIGSTRDVTADKQREMAQNEAVLRDAVTGLYNKDYGEKLTSRYISSACEVKAPFTFCIIDIDDFNRIENLYGMLFCDAVLAEIGYTIINELDKNDIGFRIGGDELAIILAGTFPAQADVKINKIKNALKYVYAGAEMNGISVSVGAAGCGDADNYHTLLEFALRALRYTKDNKDCYSSVFSIINQNSAELMSDKFLPLHLSTVSEMLDAIDGNIVNFTFNIFEKTADVSSTINVILPRLGRMFNLSRIFITDTDLNFGTDCVKFQWCADKNFHFDDNIVKIVPNSYDEFVNMLENDGMIVLSGDKAKKLKFDDILKFPSENSVMLVCSAYENGKYMGAVVFERCGVYNANAEGFNDFDRESLHEIAKIFATHISRSKSDLASRAKSEFLSRMSHEIRTPMNAIIGMTEIARSFSDNPKRLAECLDKIDVSTKYLLSLINDVLDMSRIESGRMHIEKGTVEIDEMTRNLDTLIRPQAQAKNISLDIKCDVRDKFLTGDEFRINQVLVNLLGNAVKFTPQNGKVILNITQVLQENNLAAIKFSVCDNGIGISPENTNRIFNAFEQADNNTARKFGGTGLGLAISSNIVQMMGGKLEVKSTLGVGSDFFFTIIMPVLYNKSSKPLNQKTQNIDYVNHFTGKHALLVEDNELNTEIAQYILGKGGFEVDCAENGLAAVNKFSASPENYYDVILMDIRMPVMDGLEATVKLRCLDRSDAAKVMIVAMTANAFDDDMKKSIASGMNGHVAKPIDTDKLFALLDRLLFKK